MSEEIEIILTVTEFEEHVRKPQIENNLLNAAFDQFISDTTAWELTDPKVQEKKQDLLNKVRGDSG